MSLRYWFVIITFVVVAQLFGAVLAIPLAALGLDLGDVITISTIASFGLGLLIIWLLIRKESDPVRGHEPPMHLGWSVLLGIGGLFAAIFAQNIAFQLQQLLYDAPVESENTQMLLDIMTENIWLLVAVVILGPILEELVFRQAIFGHLYRKMNFFWAALISSVVFSVIHLDFMHILVYTAVGFVFAGLYVWSKRIIVPIIAHVLMNAFASLPILLDIDLEDLEEMEENLQFIFGILGAWM
ncbi:CPBP family intramembrane glutamic endopeptidase [Salicibibacter kimchii]|uniref:CPBP family intramembrane metalloprotease n=1 Tax=Salicibibacter kimchii TaxID=2099786 RepID=A0A345C2H3_9BACI|nr:type II CAAX endopeptidase family protein [Salicibibacter kimchii]AXF57404.1 CPBP family intramembrane metalloprotease [Salicibibacter kimchii]